MDYLDRPDPSMIADHPQDRTRMLAGMVYGSNDEPRIYRYAKRKGHSSIVRRPVAPGQPGTRFQPMDEVHHTPN